MPTWDKDALCKGMHLDIFYPPLKEDRKSPEAAYYRMGKLVCEHCPIQQECLEKGKEEVFGLWGGHTPKERSLGMYSPPKSVLPAAYVGMIPRASEEALVLKDAFALIKPYLKRRNKKGS